MPSDVMMTERERGAWIAIRTNIELAQQFVAGFDFAAFTEDRRTFYAATRCLEITSEAARRLRGTQQAAHPQLEWRQIEASGNVFRHDYDDVQERVVWATVHERLPPLWSETVNALAGEVR